MFTKPTISFINQYLFSDHYLNERLLERPEWTEDVLALNSAISAIYEDQKAHLSSLDEAKTEERFIKPILKALGFSIEVRPNLGSQVPDYALFSTRENKDAALGVRDNVEHYFANALAIAEAKYWARKLDLAQDQQLDSPSRLTNKNPSFQIRSYLTDSGTEWGILSNGKKWRLYKNNKGPDTYYEIDLEEILNSDLDEFKYFALFFRREAFERDSNGKCFLNHIFDESTLFAAEIEKSLRERVVDIVTLLGQGFVRKDKTDKKNDGSLKNMYEASLILLYRLLFVLYAESRGLLPLKNRDYREEYSLQHLKEIIAQRLDGGRNYATESTALYSRLKDLFQMINASSQSLGIPAYNGGLFKPDNHPFLEERAVGDYWLALAIDALSRRDTSSGRAYIDYKDLGIRQLGSIYEGLLEFHFIQDDGELSLENDKGERKASGSYYTPEFVVKFIVENTLEPILQDKSKKLEKLISEVNDKVKNTRGANREIYNKKLISLKENVPEHFLSTRVLDPAMGSGHFLVAASDYIATFIATHPSYQSSSETNGDIEYISIKRKVVENCIYGVDINPLAVELAKLSLWLSCVDKGKPLSFLDHHLKCGNSIIGANIDELATLPEKKKRTKKDDFADMQKRAQMNVFEMRFRERVPIMVSDVIKMLLRDTDSLRDVSFKEELNDELNDMRRPFRTVADFWTSTYFGNDIDPDLYGNALASISDKSMQRELNKDKKIQCGSEIAQERHFFHWEIEFPEVFFDSHGNYKEQEAGFDVVMGNPPYGGVFSDGEKKFVSNNCQSQEYGYESYIIFLEMALRHSVTNGYAGLIIPNTWLTNEKSLKIRKLVLSNTRIRKLLEIYDVFPDAVVEPIVAIMQKNASNIAVKEKDTEIIRFSRGKKQFLLSDANVVHVNQEEWEKSERSIIVINLLPHERTLLKKIISKSLPVKQAARVLTGIKPYQVGKGTPRQTKEIVKNRIFTSDKKIDDTCKPYVTGTDISRYEIKMPNDQWISYGKWLAEPRIQNEFNQTEKLFIRRTDDRVLVAYDRKQLYSLNSAHTLTVNKQSNDLLIILAQLNSRLINWVFQKQNYQMVGKPLAEVKVVFVERLPLFDFSMYVAEEERLSLGELAKKMIELNKEKQVNIGAFLSWLESEIIRCSVENIKKKKKIKEFYKHDFDSLIDSLKFNKLIPSPAPPRIRDPIEEAYSHALEKIRKLNHDIVATDNLIDQIIYKLYDLSSNEITMIQEQAALR